MKVLTLGGARTDLSGLTGPEAQALFLLVGPAAAASATMVDPAPWGDRERSRPGTVDALQDAVVRRQQLRLVYDGRSRERTERVVDPWGLVDKDDVWYLVAGTGRGRRTFRVDRIVRAGQRVTRPMRRPPRRGSPARRGR